MVHEMPGWRPRGNDDSGLIAMFVAGRSTAMPHGFVKGHGIAAGDVLVSGAGANIDGYRSELERTMIVGEPSPEQVRAFDAMLALQTRAIETMAPGVPAGEDAIARPARRPGALRVVVRRPAKMPRTLGPSALFAACYGNVGSSIYYALGVTAAFALGLTPLALILAGFIFVTTALNYAEGTAALPHAGGSSSFARRAFNAPIGFIVGWVQLLNYTATVSISSYFAISYLGFLGKYVPALAPLATDQSTHVGATVVLIAILVAVNVIGIQESSALNLVLAFTDLVTQLVLVILGIILLLDLQTVVHNIHWGVAPTWGNFLAGISIAMVTYTGIETISNLSEEAKDPGRNVPRATWWVIIAVLFVSAFLPTIGVSVFPVTYDQHLHAYTTQLATTYKADPVAGIVMGFQDDLLRFWA